MSEENTTQAPGLVLPDDAAMADRVTATDRLLSFDAAGNPVTATAEQVKTYAADGLATTQAMTAALEKKANVNGDGTKVFAAKNVQTEYLNVTKSGTANYMYIGRGDKISSDYAATEIAIQNNAQNGTIRLACATDPVYTPIANPGVRHKLWHSGNFDPATTVKTEDVAVNNGLDAIPFFGSRKVVGLNVANVEVSSMLNMEYANQIVQLKISDYLGQLSAHIRGSNSRTWRQLYHTGNLNPATAASVGLMSAEDKIKLNSVASALSLPVQAADTPATLSLTDEAIPETVVTPEIGVRAQRAAQYQMQADELLYDALEAFARNHPEYSEFAAWLEAKDRIRQELPKPQEGGTNE